MPKGPSRKKTEKTETRTSILSLANLAEPNQLTPMNFRVSAQFHREFKLYAVQHGMSMVDLLQEAFRNFRDRTAKA